MHCRRNSRCRDDGWRVTLLYLWLSSPRLAIERVAKRIQEGGHDIPAAVITRRYWKGFSNMRLLYLPLADVAAIYDNSGPTRILVADHDFGLPLQIHDPLRWQLIRGRTP